MVTSATLLDKITARQQAGKLSDHQFATKLGIPRAFWTQMRNGKRSIGLTLLKAIVKTYPDMTSDIIAFLKDSGGGD